MIHPNIKNNIANLLKRFSSCKYNLRYKHLKSAPNYQSQLHVFDKNQFISMLIQSYIQSYLHNENTDQKPQSYLEENKLLSKFQFGFRRNHSTQLSVTYFTDNILRAMDQLKLSGALFIDLK